jgi:hypothetical protein
MIRRGYRPAASRFRIFRVQIQQNLREEAYPGRDD